MKNKPLIIFSAFLTVFLLSIGIGVITTASAKASQAALLQPTIDATAVAQREAAYQQMIDQANQQIEQANQQIEQANLEILNLAAQIQTEPTIQPTPTFGVSVEQAILIAEGIAGVAPRELPELVLYEGIPAYEVKYLNGKLYIDADSGNLLFNGLVVQQQKITTEQALNIAMKYLPQSQPLEMSVSTFDGENVYVVLFSDGQRVFVNMFGKVVAVQMAAPSQSSNDSFDDDHDDDFEEDDD